jgi:ketosteroid isomerase-like protein
MSDAAALDQKLNQAILAGNALAAFDEFYADDVVMQENNEAPRHGKAVSREFEVAFFSSIETFHGATCDASAVNGDTSFSQWTWDLTFKGGPRIQMQQVAVRQWKAGKVAHERFFYSK